MKIGLKQPISVDCSCWLLIGRRKPYLLVHYYFFAFFAFEINVFDFLLIYHLTKRKTK